MEPQTPPSFTPPVQPIPPHEFRKKYPFVAYTVLVLFILALGLFFANLHFHFFDKKEVASPEVNSVVTNPGIKSDVQQTGGATLPTTEVIFSDTLIPYIVASAPLDETTAIVGNTVVFRYPTDAQIERLQNGMGEEGGSEIIDDYSYYTYIAQEYLKEQHAIVVIAETRYLSFIVENKIVYLDTEADEDDFGLTLFFGNGKMPHIVYPIDVEREYPVYYKKK